MKNQLKETVKPVIASILLSLVKFLPSDAVLTLLRRVLGFQLTADQAKLVIKAIRRHKNCSLLVFGLGYDSELWNAVNHKGHTLFLEDNKNWFESVSRNKPQLNSRLVKYNTTRHDWKMLLSDPDKLEMQFDQEITDRKWDVILIDGPNGWLDSQPGRMSPIYMSTKLVKPHGDVFVHDCHREVEE